MKPRRMLLALLTIANLWTAASARAQTSHPLLDLEPGHWYVASNTNLRPHLPDPIPPNWGGPDSIMEAWSGAAYDNVHHRLLVWGGGHADYSGNEVYAFDVAILSWSRIWGPTLNSDIPNDAETYEIYLDGNPSSRHTYGGLQYIPTTNEFWSQGGSRWKDGGGTYATWTLDLDTLTWTRQDDAPDSMLGVVSAFDPVTGHVFQQGGWHFSEYDPATGSYEMRGAEPSAGWWEDGMSADIDQVNRFFVAVGEGVVRVWDLEIFEYTASQATTGGESVVNGRPGITYDPVLERLVGWQGGTSLFSLDTDTWTWFEHLPATTNTEACDAPPHQGTYGRFRYVPHPYNVFILVNSIDSNVCFVRLSDGSGVPPDSVPPAAPMNLTILQ